MTMTGRVLAGRYRLHEIIGQGGMAVVHRAHDGLLDRDVAIKLLRPAYASDPAFVVRFRSEARHAAGLHHRHIVTIHDTGTDPESGTDYIVMQLVDGPDLETVLSREGRLPLGQALRIGIETTQALQVAHEHGIVHRDVKPGNILLDHDGEVRVADFGIARAVRDAGSTTSGMVLGSPQYASPEQVLGEPITLASDIYSLGAVLYEAITGWRPFDGASPAAIALERLRIQPAPPSAVAPDVPPEIDRIIQRAMARQPADRYPSAAELGVALERFRALELGGVRRTGARLRSLAVSGAAVGGAVGGASGANPGAPTGGMAGLNGTHHANNPPAAPQMVPADAPPPMSAAQADAVATGPLAGQRRLPFGRTRPDAERSRRTVVPLALAFPIGALALVLVIGIGLFGGSIDGGRVLSATGVPGGSSAGGFAIIPTATPSSSPATTRAPGRSPIPSASASASPSP
ncbi:MAG: protein kinase, partial [Candidatus Limnocylindrales bacterium]